uniref:Uncharacterized protein n=1 Tax=Rhizophora mucronata TaxID=61149 RepID=A0A2P2PDZ1_RHIMU
MLSFLDAVYVSISGKALLFGCDIVLAKLDL